MPGATSPAPLRFGVDDRPAPIEALLFGLQHVLVMFTAVIGPPLVIARVLDLSVDDAARMISGTMLGCGVGTCLAALGLGVVGARLPLVLGVFAVFIAPVLAIAGPLGLAAASTALIIGAVATTLLSPMIGRLVHLFPPVVAGSVLLVTGACLIRIAAGLATATGAAALPLAAGVILLIVLLNGFGPAPLRAVSLSASLVAGYAVAAALGMVDVSRAGLVPWIRLPEPLPFGRLQWPGAAGLGVVLLCFLAAAVETTVQTVAVSRICGRQAGPAQIRGAVAADGIGSLCSALFGGLALTSYSQNIGAIVLTGVASRFVVAVCGAILVALSFLPKLATIIAVMPAPVVGGALLFMFGTIAYIGIDTLAGVPRQRRDLAIVALPLAIGLGVTSVPAAAFDPVPAALRALLGDGVIAGMTLAILLHLVLPAEKPAPKPNA